MMLLMRKKFLNDKKASFRIENLRENLREHQEADSKERSGSAELIPPTGETGHLRGSIPKYSKLE